MHNLSDNPDILWFSIEVSAAPRSAQFNVMRPKEFTC
jgi:hypothetical protein